MISDLIKRDRSYRRFDSTKGISFSQVKKWIELARFSASGRNIQSLKYAVTIDQQTSAKIFPNLGWAGYLTDWKGPAENERPVAYISVLHDKSISDNYFCDDGIAMQSILLGAVEDGYGGCIIGTVNKNKVAKILKLPENLEILWVIALGKPAETCILEEVQKEDIKYWRDKSDIHHVPKRPLTELIIKKG